MTFILKLKIFILHFVLIEINLLSTQHSIPSNNASGLSHSVGILVKQMPFVSFATIRYEGKFERDHK